MRYRPISRRGLLGVIFSGFILTVAAAAYQWPSLPVKSSLAPVTEFSAERALEKIKSLTQEPHPIGSLANETVRTRLVAELKRMNAVVAEQNQFIVGQRQGRFSAGFVHNVIARLHGTEKGATVLLSAHFDSAPHSYGAADDGFGVGILLETLRALSSGPLLKHDVIFLFSDGEEAGLLGARAFALKHRWFTAVKAAFNFDARGHALPFVLFETGRSSQELVGDYAEGPLPLADSLSYTLYKLLPSDTDFSEFREGIRSGLNFALAGGGETYHTPLDRFETLDPVALQLAGEQALRLVQHAADNPGLDVTYPRKLGGVAYYSLPGGVFVHYPHWVAMVLGAAAAAAALLILVLSKPKWGELIKGGLLSLLALVVVPVVATLGRGIGSPSLADSHPHPSWPYLLIGYGLVSAALWNEAIRLLRTKYSADSLSRGMALVLAILCLGISLPVPDAGHVLTWPLLAWAFAQWQKRFQVLGWLVIAIAQARLAMVLTIFAPQVPAIALFAVLVTFALVLGEPLTSTRASRRTALAGAVIVVTALICPLVIGTRPTFSDVSYCLEADTGSAFWSTAEPRLDDWSSQFFGKNSERRLLKECFSTSRYKRLVTKAPVVELPAPQVEVQRTGAGSARISLQPGVGARQIYLWITGDLKITNGSLNGQRLPKLEQEPISGEPAFRLGVVGVHGEKLELKLEFQGEGKARLRVADVRDGFAVLECLEVPARPPGVLPYGLSDSVIVSKSVAF